MNSQKPTVPQVGFHPPTQVYEISSGLAWYREIAKTGNGQEPGAYIDIKQGGNVTWEAAVNSGSSIFDLTSPCSYRLHANTIITGVFPDGDTFTCVVLTGAQSKPYGSLVGVARNNFRTFKVYKDNNRVLYEVNGWQVHSIYYAE